MLEGLPPIILSDISLVEISHSTTGYDIAYCGEDTPAVNQSLVAAMKILQEVIADINSRSSSQVKAFQTFFDGVSRDYVRDVFQSMLDHAPAPLRSGDRKNPVVICVRSKDTTHPKIKMLYKFCQKDHRTAGLSVAHFVILCPGFLQFPRVPANAGCPKIVGKNLERGTLPFPGGIVNGNQISVIIHELVHLYLRVIWLKPEAYGLKASQQLPAGKAMINPDSYTLYAASEYHLPAFYACSGANIGLAVLTAGCTFPGPLGVGYEPNS